MNKIILYNIKPIGFVKSSVKKPVDENWGEVISEIHIAESLAEGLRGINQFSHAIVVFYLHKATFTAATDLVRRPRNLSEMPETGIFAQRAKHRPNPIGITAVEIVQSETNILTVRGLDAIDGTPVLDIKPYYPAYDKVDGTQVPEWVNRLMEDYF